MLEARRAIYRETLSRMIEPLTIWTRTADDLGEDVRELAQSLADLSPLISVRHEYCTELSLSPLNLGIISPSGPQGVGPLGARFAGVPDGFLLDLLVDEIVALSRGQELASALARETLSHLQGPVQARVFGTPG